MKFSLKKIFSNKEFSFAFGIMLLICLLSYVLTCAEFYGEYTNVLISSGQLCINNYYGKLSYILRLIMPVVAALPCAGLYYNEKKNNILPLTLTKMSSPKKYFFNSLVSCFVASFLVVALPLLINILLNYITFPAEAIRNSGNHPSSDDPYYSVGWTKYILLDYIRINFPQAYNVIFAFFISLFSGLIGVLTFIFSFFFKKNNHLTFALFFVYSNLVDFFSSITSEYGVNISYFDYLIAGNTISGKNVLAFVGMIIVLLVAGVIGSFFAVKRLYNNL